MPKDVAEKQCTLFRTKMVEKMVKAKRMILLPKNKKVRKIIKQRVLKTPIKFRNVTVEVKTMVPSLEQRT